MQIYGRDLDDNGEGFWSKLGHTVYKDRAGLHSEGVSRERYAGLGPKKKHRGNAQAPVLIYGRDLDNNGDGSWSNIGHTVHTGSAGLHKEIQRDRYAGLGPKKKHGGNAVTPQLVRSATAAV